MGAHPQVIVKISK